ncbi:ferrous iron transport protein B [Caloranaerobacter azorensis DSM 13643]|uniref:Ferrous iron transport protein B n=1 Tax=Caloranaerobacter azorensis DSM 13643 TaxID=1121264 RepID=A0A1M5VQJ5_9FIRM|nr:FeoB small GTPase domain-containing protein [Caloranaerobacter azorensis]SHH77507.1 ferrous iron transport protein B [Caloranaerobacter azorensis DSM 13643]
MEYCQDRPWYKKLIATLLGINNCDGEVNQNTQGLEKIALVGSPNVGKSVLFNILTGAYVTVSNYPGTTVEVSRGRGKIGNKEYEIIDTPGMYSLMCITEEEKVTRELLLRESPKAVIHVIDAKNIQRMLPLTIQLIESGLPVILVLNIMDEAERMGLKINVAKLEKDLGIPVIPTIAALNKGIDTLKERIGRYVTAA